MKNAIRIASVLMAAVVLLTLSPTAAVAVPPTPSSFDGTVVSFEIYLPIITKNHLPDTTPPAAVTDLATSNPTLDSITLNWTAPGDDGNTGTASEYDIRYSTSLITDANWDAAAQCAGEPAPQPAGSGETFTVNGLTSGMTYHFALKTADEVPLWSGLSNVASGATLLSCDELIANGGFEYDGDWEIPTTAYSAGYTIAAAHSGSRSMRLGIVEPADNVYSYSSVRQAVTIPADAASAMLSFWLYPMSEEPAGLTPPARPLASTLQALTLADDLHYVLILDQYNEWIDTLLWQRSDDRQWIFHQFDLMAFAGRTIKLQFGVLNDGVGGITSMYLDDVSLEFCTASPCSELIANSGFEATEAWVIGDTPRPAGYTTNEAHWGTRSMRLGIEPPTTDAYSWSSVRQRITIPADAASATLSFWYKPFTEDISQRNWQRFDWSDYGVDQPGRIPPNANPLSWMSSDWQQALILADDFPNPTILATVMSLNSNSGVWTHEAFDLMPFAGQTVWVYFNVYNDGWGYKRTWMYLDDVSVRICH